LEFGSAVLFLQLQTQISLLNKGQLVRLENLSASSDRAEQAPNPDVRSADRDALESR
jgi:hypothetical protein